MARFQDQRQNNGNHVPVKVPEWDFRVERSCALEASLESLQWIEEQRAAGNPGPFKVPPDQCDIVVRDVIFILKPSGIAAPDGSIHADVMPVANKEVMRTSFKAAKERFMEVRAAKSNAGGLDDAPGG